MCLKGILRILKTETCINTQGYKGSDAPSVSFVTVEQGLKNICLSPFLFSHCPRQGLSLLPRALPERRFQIWIRFPLVTHRRRSYHTQNFKRVSLEIIFLKLAYKILRKLLDLQTWNFAYIFNTCLSRTYTSNFSIF